MNLYVDGVLTPPADAGSLDGIPADLAPHGAGQDGYVVTYSHANGDLELQPGGGGGMVNPMTAVGNLIVGGPVSGGIATPVPLAIGTGGYVLRSVAGNPAWREISAAGLLANRAAAAAVREGQTYWATDAATGQKLSICLHQGGVAYAWETLAYGASATGAAVVQAANAAAARAAIGITTRSPVAPTCAARWLLDDSGAVIADSVGTTPLAYSGGASGEGRPSPWGASIYTGGLAAGAGPKGATALEPSAITMLAWVCAYAYSSPDPILVLKRQSDAIWGGALHINAAIAMTVSPAGLPNAYALSTTNVMQAISVGAERRIPLNVWCRIAVSYSTATELRIYVDGQIAATAPQQGALDYALHGSWSVGVNQSGSGVSQPQYFDGFVRDVQICPTVLTAAQILADFQQGVGTYEAP